MGAWGARADLPPGTTDRFLMIDLFALAVPHFVMAIAVWRLVQRADLDDDPALPGREQPVAKPLPDRRA
jgi:hypothetical protein